jgi:hypothetical protein
MESPQEQPNTKQKPESFSEKQEPLLKLDNTLDEIGNRVENLEKAKLSPEQKTRLESLKEKTKKATKNFLKIAKTAVYVGGLISIPIIARDVTEFSSSRVSLEKTIDGVSHTTYLHPDQRTTHYLNILAGKEKFIDNDLEYAQEKNLTTEDLNKLAGFEKMSDEDVERLDQNIWREQIKRIYKQYSLPVPNTEGMSSLDLAFLYFKDPVKGYESLEREKAVRESSMRFEQEKGQEYKERYGFRSSVNEDIYDLVWEMEEECGNPKIRFINESPEQSRPPPEGRAFYSFQDNTIHINIASLVEVGSSKTGSADSSVPAEMSHAKQFKDNPLGSTFKCIRDNVGTFVKSILHGKSFLDFEHEQYDEEGRLEYEAHKIIEPYLKSKYPIQINIKENNQ